MACMHILWNSIKPQCTEVTNRDISKTSCQAIHPSMPSSIHPLPSKLFFIAAANAAARTETKLALWPPPPLLAVCWRVCLFSMSPPSPCSPSNLSLKTSFLPFIIFFFLPFSPHLQQHHAAWHGRPGESCDRRGGCCLGKEKGSVCQNPFLAQLGGQGSTQPWSNQFKPQKGRLTFTLSLVFAVSNAIFLFSFAFWPLVWPKCLSSKPEVDCD